MLFRRLVLCALFVGLLAGSLLTAVQELQVLPLIAAAERYENPPGAAGEAHVHEALAWAPADGSARTLWTLLANVATAIGLALLVLPAMSAWDARRPAPAASWRNGLVWGTAGYLCFFVVPGLGLPPEIPGAAGPALTDRQAWWLLAVAASTAAMVALCLARQPWRWSAIGLFALPFAIGAPTLGIDPFAGYAPEVAAEMHHLAHDFVLASALAIGLHWLALGAAAGFAVRRWLRPVVLATLHGQRVSEE